MSKDKNPDNYIEDYLIIVRSKGCFTVAQNELLEKFNISPISFNDKSEFLRKYWEIFVELQQTNCFGS